MLTLGIGVNAGIFGIINGLHAAPACRRRGARRGRRPLQQGPHHQRGYRAFSYPGFAEVRDAGGPFAHLAAHNVALGGVTEDNTTRQALVDIVSTGYFEALGVRPVYGRDFTADEERPGTAARPVIISYRLWERSGFDRDILTQTVRINGQDYGIVGVAPERFSGTTAIIGTEYFLPLGVHDAIESDFDSRDALADLGSPQPLADPRRTPESQASRANRRMSS